MRLLLVICGPPRSGTTWIHNALIRCGAFAGIEADADAEESLRGEDGLFTDEEPLSTQAAAAFTLARTPFGRATAARRFAGAMGRLYERFALDARLMVESPYYCFGLPAFAHYARQELRIVHMKRDADANTASMTRHRHLARKLAAELDDSCDLYHRSPLRMRAVELQFAHPRVLAFTREHYPQLTLAARALFKRHCFERACRLGTRGIPPGSRISLDYDRFANDTSEQERLASFVGLNPAQMELVQRSFRYSPPPAVAPPLGESGEGLRRLIAELEATP